MISETSLQGDVTRLFVTFGTNSKIDSDTMSRWIVDNNLDGVCDILMFTPGESTILAVKDSPDVLDAVRGALVSAFSNGVFKLRTISPKVENFNKRSTSMRNSRIKRINESKRKLHEAESYGWVVDNNEAWEAYDFACEYFGKEELDAQIVGCMSVDELASDLAFIFRMNDFREWEDYKNGEELDENLFMEDTSKEWKPNIRFNHIKDIYNKVKRNNYKFVNNEREEFMAAVNKATASNSTYTPEQRKQLRDWHQEIFKAHKNQTNESLVVESLNVDMSKLLSEFNKEYNWLYNNNTGSTQTDATEFFDNIVSTSEEFKSLVQKFVGYRGDFISSDREAAAFSLACENLGILDQLDL